MVMSENVDREVLNVLGELAVLVPHKSFTKVQARCIPTIVQCNEHVIVAAPTGSGKTLLMEIAIMKLFKFRLLQNKTAINISSTVAAAATAVESKHQVHKTKRVHTLNDTSERKEEEEKEYQSKNLNESEKGMKAVYICPMKALANEKYNSWTELFPALSVIIETGDQDMNSAQENWNDEERLERVSQADIIITTPERWDSITRRWKESYVFAIVNGIGLLLLDEVHTIHEERGAALEAVVSRMKAIINEVNQVHSTNANHFNHTIDNSTSNKNDNLLEEEDVETTETPLSFELSTPSNAKHVRSARLETRFIAISGTLPNVNDFAEWLHVPSNCVFTFSQADRPVPLTIKVLSFRNDSNNPYAFDRFLSFKLLSLVREYSDGRPTLLFCASRRDAVSSAERIINDIKTIAERDGRLRELEPLQSIRYLVQGVSDKLLRSALSLGVGFHHAALTLEDRKCVENMFRNGQLAVLCTTTTLALGVNLPAHLVIIKGTTFFNHGVRGELPLSEVAQMCGRAGRPGLDQHGVALILTTQRAAPTYLPLTLTYNDNKNSNNNDNNNNNNDNNCKKFSLYHGRVSNIERNTPSVSVSAAASRERERVGVGVETATVAESQLHRHMIEHVNAEIALRTIHNFQSAIAWVKTTFFWTRLPKCPTCYGLTFSSDEDAATFKPLVFVQKLIERVLQALAEAGCIILPKSLANANDVNCLKNTENNTTLSQESLTLPLLLPFDEMAPIESTRVGRAMSRLYILFDTVCLLNAELYRKTNQTTLLLTNKNININNNTDNDIKVNDVSEKTEDENEADEENGCNNNKDNNSNVVSNCNKKEITSYTQHYSLPQILELLSKFEEFSELRLRQGDKGPLNEINKLVRFPIHGGRRGGREVREDWHKIYLLIQCQLSQIQITDVSVRNDLIRGWILVPRLARFLHLFVSYMSVDNNNNNNYNSNNNNRNSSSDKKVEKDIICCLSPSLNTFSLFVQTHLLQRCVERRIWHDGLVLRQLNGITESIAKLLMESRIRTFADIRATDPHKLEILCGKPPPFGTVLRNQIFGLPHCVNVQVTRVDEPECKLQTFTKYSTITKTAAADDDDDANDNDATSSFANDNEKIVERELCGDANNKEINSNSNNSYSATYVTAKKEKTINKSSRRICLTHEMLQQRRPVTYSIKLSFKINNNNDINNNDETCNLYTRHECGGANLISDDNNNSRKGKNKLHKVERTHNVLLLVGDNSSDRILLRREFSLPVQMSTTMNMTSENYKTNFLYHNKHNLYTTSVSSNNFSNNNNNTIQSIMSIEGCDNNDIYVVEYTFTLYEPFAKLQQSKPSVETTITEQLPQKRKDEQSLLSQLSVHVLTQHLVGNDIEVKLSDCMQYSTVTINNDAVNTETTKDCTSKNSNINNWEKCNKSSAFDAFCADLQMIDTNSSKKLKLANNKERKTKECNQCEDSVKENKLIKRIDVATKIKSEEAVEQCKLANEVCVSPVMTETEKPKMVLPQMLTEDARNDQCDDDDDDVFVSVSDNKTDLLYKACNDNECEREWQLEPNAINTNTVGYAAADREWNEKKCDLDASCCSEAEAAYCKANTGVTPSQLQKFSHREQEKESSWEWNVSGNADTHYNKYCNANTKRLKTIDNISNNNTNTTSEYNNYINNNSNKRDAVSRRHIQLPPCPPSPEPVNYFHNNTKTIISPIKHNTMDGNKALTTINTMPLIVPNEEYNMNESWEFENWPQQPHHIPNSARFTNVMHNLKSANMSQNGMYLQKPQRATMHRRFQFGVNSTPVPSRDQNRRTNNAVKFADYYHDRRGNVYESPLTQTVTRKIEQSFPISEELHSRYCKTISVMNSNNNNDYYEFTNNDTNNNNNNNNNMINSYEDKPMQNENTSEVLLNEFVPHSFHTALIYSAPEETIEPVRNEEQWAEQFIQTYREHALNSGLTTQNYTFGSDNNNNTAAAAAATTLYNRLPNVGSDYRNCGNYPHTPTPASNKQWNQTNAQYNLQRQRSARNVATTAPRQRKVKFEKS